MVKTGRPDIPIELYNTINGYTNDKGELLVPEMTSYIDNKVSLAANTLTINDSVDHNEQYVAVKQRGSGSVVAFAIQKFTAIEGNLTLLTADNKVEKLESVPIEIRTQNKKYEGALGREGYFYLENIPVGEHTLTVLLYKGNCSVRIKVAETTKIVQKLGSLTCKVTSTNNAAIPTPVQAEQINPPPVIPTAQAVVIPAEEANNQPAPPSKPSITGTKWHYIDADWQYDLEFAANGVLLNSHPKDKSKDNDSWEQDGDNVNFYFNNKFSHFSATLSENKQMSGTATNKKGSSWTWKASLIE